MVDAAELNDSDLSQGIQIISGTTGQRQLDMGGY